MDSIEQVVDNMDVGDLQTVLLGGKAKMESGKGAVSDPIQSAVDGMSTKDLSQVLIGEQGGLVEEGGNKFKNASRINQENAGPTMDDLKKKLHELSAFVGVSYK